MHSSREVQLYPSAFYQLDRVGDVLFYQAQRHPLFEGPWEKFQASLLVAEYTGMPEAFGLAFEAGRLLEPNQYNPYLIKSLGETAMVQHGEEGIYEALEVADLMGTSPESELDRIELFVEMVERTTDESYRQNLAEQTLQTLESMDFSKSDDYLGLRSSARAELALRLALALKDPSVVGRSIDLVTPKDRSFGITTYLAETLGSPELDDQFRDSLVEATIRVTRTRNNTYPAQIVRGGFEQTLHQDELIQLMQAVHRDGSAKFLSDRDYSKGEVGILIYSRRELEGFIDLADRYGTWASKDEQRRYKRKALRLKFHREYRPPTGANLIWTYGSAVRSAKHFSEKLQQSPVIQDQELLDRMTEGFTDDELEGQYNLKDMGLWWDITLEHIAASNYRDSAAKDRLTLVGLRNRLPEVSAARLAINKALFISGDDSALVNSASCLAANLDKVITYTGSSEANKDKKLPNVHVYRDNFFQIFPTKGERDTVFRHHLM